MSKRVSKQARKKALENKKKRQRRMWGIGMLGVLLILIAAVVSLSSVASYEIDPSDTASVALGQQVYATNCASCHGENLEGEEILARGSLGAKSFHDRVLLGAFEQKVQKPT